MDTPFAKMDEHLVNISTEFDHGFALAVSQVKEERDSG
jgi:hypothetical protein